MSNLELALKSIGFVLVVPGFYLALRYRRFGDGNIPNDFAAMRWQGGTALNDYSNETRRDGARRLRIGLWMGLVGALLQLVAFFV